MPAYLAVMLMLADGAITPRTDPARAEPATELTPRREPVLPADPLYDQPRAAADDPSFVLTAVESGRQGVMDARAGEASLPTPELRAAAAKIGRQHEATLTRIEAVARKKGWRLPAGNPERATSVPMDKVPVESPARASASFIINQIALHVSTMKQFRAQISGEGDAELRRVLRDALPGYEKNLDMLLGLKL